MAASDAGGVASLFEPFFAAALARPFVIAQLGQSLDGRVATATGVSRSIGGPAALDHLHRLRAHVDAVVVGINTVLIDDPQLTVRRVPGRSPARIVIDPGLRLPPSAKCLDPDTGGCYVVCAAAGRVPAGAVIIRLEATDGIIPAAAIVDALFARGFRRMLVEGGPRTISAFIDAGCVDRLHVVVAPVIIGSGVAGLNLAPIAGLTQALRPAARIHVLPDGNVIFDCDLRSHVPGIEV